MQIHDFKAVAAAALDRAETLVPQWLPGGRRQGVEWRCGSVRGDEGQSLAVNLTTGVWMDFSSDSDKGSDLVSLFAAIFHNNDQGAAVRELSRTFGIAQLAGASPAAPKPEKKSRTPWQPVLPVPAGSPPAPRAHPVRGLPEMSWEYRNAAGQLLGVVYRFITSDGGKEVLPAVWGHNTETGASQWRWLSFPDPRPLYAPDAPGRVKTGLVVEGEKCVDVARRELSQWFDVVSWPGGGKAASKADWDSVIGRGWTKAVLWPDADSKRVKGTEPEDQRPYVEAALQPGLKTMDWIATRLAGLGLDVRMVDIPPPGALPDGWDVADMVAAGTTGEALRDWIVAHLRQPAVEETATIAAVPAVAAPASTPEPAAARGVDWTARLIKKNNGRYEDCKENIAMLLEDHPELLGLVAYNEFSGITEKCRETPRESRDLEWSEDDDRELGMMLAQRCDVLIRSTGTIGEGVSIVANRNRHHPVRDWLTPLKWDHVDRNGTWLTKALGVAASPYSQLVGSLWLKQAVNRILHPGCKGDYALILEGKQGKGKSTALKTLGGEWFSDAALDLSNKDASIALSGVWIYEIAELDAFNRAEATRIKAFVSMADDRYRPPYGKRYITRPRQTVFAGTTNNDEYFKDPTGNRRFWPIYCHNVDIEWLAANREQIFAQALHEVRAGERAYPTRDEEMRLIVPEQEQREIGDPWIELINAWLNDTVQSARNQYSTADILIGAIKMTPDRMDGQRSAATRVGNCMKKLGWGKRRGSDGDLRPWLYTRPERLASSDSQAKGAEHDPLPI
ncbi:hypothetical protein GCM10007242_45310 [Pigmentiphaga litoralis]|uniref:VapE domain-containing protein n=1 Tax=Pigmentiphaga litoralis TaxID=516702 RepID=UPI001676B5BD|nr:VapE domain-containing protein [Pigmentiphaga litoralis]GGX33159.1 hypothetical protein GCM10007242_45310 [Pigmentiphaga litoralis]